MEKMVEKTFEYIFLTKQKYKSSINQMYSLSFPNERETINIIRIHHYEIYQNCMIDHSNNSIIYLGKCLDKTYASQLKIHENGLVIIKKYSIHMQDKISNELNVLNFLKQNKHDNIVAIYDILRDDTNIYIIMEYCENGNLRKIINNFNETDKIINIMKQLIDVLIFLHNNKIIHNDIKPENIVFTNNYKKLKLCDFGSSLITDKHLPINIKLLISGSPKYMAPEIIQSYLENNNNSIKINNDKWAVGIIGYELLTGYHPYELCKDVTQFSDIIKNNLINEFEDENKNKISSVISKLLENNKEYSLDDILDEIHRFDESYDEIFILELD